MTKQINKLILGDCMNGMEQSPDKIYNISICDPPYGIGVDKWMSKDNNTIRGKMEAKRGIYKSTDWDKNVPPKEYFEALKRVSVNQIIFGGNYFDWIGIPHKTPRRHELSNWIEAHPKGWIVWDKENGDNAYNDYELAWTSFDIPTKKISVRWHGMFQYDMKNKETRIHPTQKPVLLYRLLLKEFAKEGDIILDTHLGSFASIIACEQEGFNYVGYEIDPTYYKDGMKRLLNFKSQTKLFQ